MASNRHTYDYTVDPASGTAPARVIRMIGSGRRVLELGCGPGAITKHLAANGCAVTAVELDTAAIEQVRPYCSRVHRANLDGDDWPALVGSGQRFEIVLAADVLEHLHDPASVLLRMEAFLCDGGSIVLSLPHIAHSAIHACLFHGDFQYRDWGLLDRTHIRFFGLQNMQALVESCNLKIVEAEFVRTPPLLTEFATAWRRLPPTLRRELRRAHHGDIYQVVLRAVRLDDPGVPVVLHELARATSGRSESARVMSLVAWLRSWIS
jgi:2-polyprenyl-3-methyl-5-hydroxy-6-metoxy-1,4-benzoquinol methylase